YIRQCTPYLQIYSNSQGYKIAKNRFRILSYFYPKNDIALISIHYYVPKVVFATGFFPDYPYYARPGGKFRGAKRPDNASQAGASGGLDCDSGQYRLAFPCWFANTTAK